MENTKTGTTIPLSTFGGLSTELSPTDLPEGGSPDCQDITYTPGSATTRPGLGRVYATPPTTAAIVYQKTFKRLDGTVFNVLMDANGAIWAENFTTSPGVFTQIGSVPAGSKCKSVEAFGKLFMAFNDGFRGTDIPRKFDGTKFSRVSQGGPAINPTFSEYIAPSVALGNGGGTGSLTVTSLQATDPITTYVRVWVGP